VTAPCTYLNAGAFRYIFSPLSIWGGGWWRSFGGHPASSQGQPGTRGPVLLPAQLRCPSASYGRVDLPIRALLGRKIVLIWKARVMGEFKQQSCPLLIFHIS